MVSQASSTNELYNLRWNSYFNNLISVFTDHQNQEALVDVTITCEGQFIKAHKLVLSACSLYFQKIFQTHTSPQLVVLLNDVKFDTLRLVVQFMYKGEVKVADHDMQQFLSLGKMLQVKGLCSVELQDNRKTQSNGDTKISNNKENTPEAKTTNEKVKLTETKKLVAIKTPLPEPIVDKEAVAKKRKLPSPSPVPTEIKKKIVVSPVVTPTPTPTPPPEAKEVSPYVPRPPNAFMIFANQWRKKLAVEYPNESNKDISVRLGNMWKSLSLETKDAFYEDARRAEEEHKVKHPGYYYSPKEAKHRKAIQSISKTAQKSDTSKEAVTKSLETEFIEIKFEEDSDDAEHSEMPSNGSN